MASVTARPIVSNLSATEEESIVSSLVCEYMVTGLTSDTTYILQEALLTSGVPQPASYAPGDYNMILCNRYPSLIEGTTDSVLVRCEYKSIAEARSTFIFSGGTSLVQITTQVDIYGNLIEVAHTFPAEADPDYSGQTKFQGGDVPVMIPQTTLTCVGRLPVDFPDEISRYWTGSYNSQFWAGSPAYTWLCTRCDFVGKDLALNRQHYWEFTWEFQHNPQTWIPIAIYTDPRSGKPPADLVYGTGYKEVEWYGLIDFNELFPNT